MALTETRILERRIGGLHELLAADGEAAAILTRPANLRYFTGVQFTPHERVIAAVLRPDGEAVLVVPRFELARLDDLLGSWSISAYDDGEDAAALLARAVEGCATVAVEDDFGWARAAQILRGGCELSSADPLIAALRGRKDAMEAAAITRACALIEECFEMLFERLRPGDREDRVNGLVKAWLGERGATASVTRILFDERTAHGHSEPTAARLRADGIVCADVAACVDGYWGDLTRCAAGGEARTWGEPAWDVVVAAQRAAIDSMRPGMPASAVDDAQREVIGASPLGECLHRAGHGIGLELHEAPNLDQGSFAPLEEGSTYTVEPGIYRLGFGGLRLEDDIQVGAEGPVWLSTADRRLRGLDQ